MVGWHHRLNGHEFEKTPGNGDGQGSLVCCSPWGHRESDTTEQLNWTELRKNVPRRKNTLCKNHKWERAWWVGENSSVSGVIGDGIRDGRNQNLWGLIVQVFKVLGFYYECNQGPLVSFKQGSGLIQSLFHKELCWLYGKKGQCGAGLSRRWWWFGPGW